MAKEIFNKQDYGEPPLNLEIYSAVQPQAKVLDVGCGPGKMGAALEDKGCFRVGIENDARLTEAAKQNYDRLIVSDIETLPELPFPEGYFDIIIFADILEHTSCPDKILSVFKRYLNDSGYILVRLPNAANWQVRLSLLLGRFNYGPGILDGGHLRFFTLGSARRLLEHSGYRIISVKARNRVVKLLGRLYKRLFAFQFIIKAVKQA